MDLLNDPLLPGWKPARVICDILLREGYDLCSRVEELPNERLSGNTVYRVTDDYRRQSFLICMDEIVDPEMPRVLSVNKNDLVICRDTALTDELAANLSLQCRLKTI
jgi:hypothetical protein